MIRVLLRSTVRAATLIGCLALPAIAAEEHGHKGGATDPCPGTVDKAAGR